MASAIIALVVCCVVAYLAGALWVSDASLAELARIAWGTEQQPTMWRLRDLGIQLHWAKLALIREREDLIAARRLIEAHNNEDRIYIERARRAEAEFAELAKDAAMLATLTIDGRPNTAAKLRLARRVLDRPSVKAMADQGRIN